LNLGKLTSSMNARILRSLMIFLNASMIAGGNFEGGGIIVVPTNSFLSISPGGVMAITNTVRETLRSRKKKKPN